MNAANESATPNAVSKLSVAGRGLRPSEKNYSNIEREELAIFWVLYLQIYNFELVYVPGRQQIADFFSRATPNTVPKLSCQVYLNQNLNKTRVRENSLIQTHDIINKFQYKQANDKDVVVDELTSK